MRRDDDLWCQGCWGEMNRKHLAFFVVSECMHIFTTDFRENVAHTKKILLEFEVVSPERSLFLQVLDAFGIEALTDSAKQDRSKQRIESSTLMNDRPSKTNGKRVLVVVVASLMLDRYVDIPSGLKKRVTSRLLREAVIRKFKGER